MNNIKSKRNPNNKRISAEIPVQIVDLVEKLVEQDFLINNKTDYLMNLIVSDLTKRGLL